MSVEPIPAGGPAQAGESAARWTRGTALTRLEEQIARLESLRIHDDADLSGPVLEMRSRLAALAARAYENLGGWQTVQIARHAERPVLGDYLGGMVRDFVELCGDRTFGDDRAMLAGFGRIAGRKVMLIGHRKGRETSERAANCFGCAHPEGYRKALRAMKLAEKYGLPVVSLIDTPGAFPGVGAEERGAAQAIAINLMEMARLRVPIVCVVLGEGGSGGALGIGVGDRVGMMRYAYYSVISPEGCASILFRDAGHKKSAAESLGLRASDLLALGLIDDIVKEPAGGAHLGPQAAAEFLRDYLRNTLEELANVPIEELLRKRAARLRAMGDCFTERRAEVS